jgi:hypothetical protein
MAIAYCNEFLRECTEGKLQDRGVYDEMASNYLAYRAEARFIRAYCYSMLCDLFGNVPIIDENAGVTDLPVQVTRAEVFKYAENELLEILGSSNSSNQDVLAEPKTALYGHVDKVAAWFLLSRMYLNAETWIGENRYNDAYTYAHRLQGISPCIRLSSDFPRRQQHLL